MTDSEKLEFLSSAMEKLFKKKFDLNTNLDTELVDIGLDSLDIVELQMYYDEVTGQESPTSSRIGTLRDLINVMK